MKAMFELAQRVTVHLGAVALAGVVVKVTFTAEHCWYGVKLDSGETLHGIDANLVAAC
jgi:hypothetical protein